MKEPSRMNIVNSYANLIHDVSNLLFSEMTICLTSFSNQFPKVSFAYFKYHVDSVLVPDNFFHFNYCGMIKLN